ncbi:2-amino-3-carboxymuconate-6-semialdehyde decarboxylase [Parachaetomium inaequale]|uniref:2-amino-3-carboxymuconate-6-semialdehyde decarboxylase n=1 Tax=Parachaetomium inaequale TaxID=2588326 RepID=A0AAN6P8C3_9PEZI|nr:2-amino-3-carboxymuconate-6-semialdehyde decarboxylase [Parachaetomium inaequale]
MTLQIPISPVVDIHTHMYPPEYISILSSRDTIPLVRTFPSSPDPRLILLESEIPSLELALTDPTAPLPGRPLTKSFTSLPAKLAFMSRHNITTSVLSLANPWLDFLPPDEAGATAHEINTSFESMCASEPGRLYFFGTLPLTAPLETILASITHLTTLPHCRGIILGTSGLGSGLDDPSLLPIFSALATSTLPIFLHPHYGLPNAVYGPRSAAGEYGHVLPLALGFPMETTIAVARMFLAGVFDAVPELRMILAHSGGTLPFLAGRIESCVLHDAALVGKMGGKEGKRRRTVWEVLREQVYLDAVIYSEVGLKAAVEAGGGADRLMFGTDHPFFPPVGVEGGGEDGVWESVGLNVQAVDKALGEGSEEARMVMGGNAVRVLRLFE